MDGNIFGSQFQVVTFGESHGVGLGAVILGCPAGITFDEELLRLALQRRRPGQSAVVTGRNEADDPEILSGIYKGKTLGTPIAIVVENKDARSEDYEQIAKEPRRGHADDIWKAKYGHVDPRGGGRSSGRETVARVIGGAMAQMFVHSQTPEVLVTAITQKVFDIGLPMENFKALSAKAFQEQTYSSMVRCPSHEVSQQIEQLLLQAKSQGESYGGQACVRIDGIPAGLGQPVFNKLKSQLAQAYLSIGATSSLSFAEDLTDGQKAATDQLSGTQFHTEPSDIYGGLRGGMSTGEPIYAFVGFKPTSSVLDVAKKGRHDPCIIPRACAVLEAMTWLCLADQIKMARWDRI